MSAFANVVINRMDTDDHMNPPEPAEVRPTSKKGTNKKSRANGK